MFEKINDPSRRPTFEKAGGVEVKARGGYSEARDLKFPPTVAAAAAVESRREESMCVIMMLLSGAFFFFLPFRSTSLY